MGNVTIKSLGERLYGSVPNVNKCTNFGALAIDGKRLWCLKTNKTNTMSTLYIYPSVENLSKFETRKYTLRMGHGNGMTYNYDTKELVIAPLDKYVQILETANAYKRRKATSTVNINNIAYVGHDRYISGNNELEIQGTKIVNHRIKRSYDSINELERFSSYNIGQDIGFYKGHVYIIRSHNTKRGNAIYRFPLYGFEPDMVYVSERAVEFESLAFSGNTMYIASNSEKGDYIFTAKL